MSVSVLIGTTKGAFILSSSDRKGWELAGPYCDGMPVNHVVGDPATGAIWAASGGGWFPVGVWHSADGRDWTFHKDGFEEAAQAIWSLHVADGTLYAGTKPAELYQSTDRGQHWQRLPALTDQNGAADWMPGAAGLTLHTIMTDPDAPQKIWVGISAAGVFASEDGGVTWEPRMRRSNQDTYDLPDFHGETASRTEVFGCVHNMVRASGTGDIIYQQNHHGTLRSADGGRNWTVISGGLPSHFGFPIGVHPRDPQTIWTFPLNGDDAGRYPPDARAAVWRSRDGGDSWQACTRGLPAEDCYFTVLRQAMAVDQGDSAGVYFGTNSGSVFASIDEGDTWSEIARHLPTILSVEVMQTD